MTPEGQAELDKIRAVRGYTLPPHDALASHDDERVEGWRGEQRPL